MVLLGIAFATFLGTIFTIISEAVRWIKITVGPPFFNQINAPIGLVLLALTGIGPLLAWRRTGSKSLIRNFTFPLVMGAIAVILFLLVGYKLQKYYNHFDVIFLELEQQNLKFP